MYNLDLMELSELVITCSLLLIIHANVKFLTRMVLLLRLFLLIAKLKIIEINGKQYDLICNRIANNWSPNNAIPFDNVNETDFPILYEFIKNYKK